MQLIFNKYKNVFRVDIQLYYIDTSGNWENEKFRVFPISTSVDITVYQYGKKFYICFII